MKRKTLFIIALLIASCSPIRGCVESQFTLAPDSRLPKWFFLPKGYSRDEVTVKLTYYSPPIPVDDTVFELFARNGQTLSKITGRRCWHPEMNNKRNQYGGFSADSYPHYIYVRASGVVEVIEHTRGPVFKISDDPTLMKQALESKRCEKS